MSDHAPTPIDQWKTVPAEVGLIADHFRLPWRFYARVLAAKGPALG